MKLVFNWFGRDKSKLFGFSFEECLTKDEADKMKALDLEKLLDADRNERLRIIVETIGKDKAEWLNSRFEKDVILKNQQKGMVNWVNNDKKISPKWREEILRRVAALENSLDKKELDDFIKGMAELALGGGITEEETRTINELCKKAENAKLEMENSGDKTAYEIALKNLEDYSEKLKNS